MKFRSCLNRYMRYILQSGVCSLLTLFINSDMQLYKFRLYLVAIAAFVIIMAVDSFFFGLYFGKKKHFKYGVIYPYTFFAITSCIGHFLIKSSRLNYLFLPFDFFECFGYTRIVSITLVHIIVIAVVSISLFIGRSRYYNHE